MTNDSQSIEDDFKATCRLAHKNGWAQTGELADALSIAPGSVSGMLRRLAEAEMVQHGAYRGVRLTDRGREEALRVIRGHSVLETCLSQVLYWDIEHAASEQMAEVFGHPRFDPPGAPIPTASGEVQSQELVPMSEIAVGWSAW